MRLTLFSILTSCGQAYWRVNEKQTSAHTGPGLDIVQRSDRPLKLTAEVNALPQFVTLFLDY